MAKVWRVIVSDGTIRYFERQSEAEFFRNERVSSHTTVMIHPVTVPETPRDFVTFMEHESMERGIERSVLAQCRQILDLTS